VLPIPLGRVLPGTTRTYTAGGQLSLPLDRTYDLTVRVGSPADGDPNTVGEVIGRFADQVSPSVAISIPSVAVCTSPDGLEVRSELANTGTLGVEAAVAFDVRDPSGTSVGTIGGSIQAPSWPDSVVEFDGLIPPGLPDGSWSLVARAMVGDGQQAGLAVPFTLGDPATAPPACDEPSSSPGASAAPSPTASEVAQP
jgi:hypothetical protein